MFNNYESIAEANKSLNIDYDWIYDMFDLSRILRIRVLGIPEGSFDDSPLNNNDLNQRGETAI